MRNSISKMKNTNLTIKEQAEKYVEIMKQSFQKNKNYYLVELLLVISWVIYLITFNSFYKEAVFFVDKKASIVVQLLFFSVYYSEQVVVYLLLAFVMTTCNLLLILMFYIKLKQQMTISKSEKNVIISFCIILALPFVFLLTTRMWILFGLILLFSLVISYVTYVITGYLDKEEEEYEENEMIKQEGPFLTKEEADKEADRLLLFWVTDFAKKGYRLEAMTSGNNDTGWHVELRVKLSSKENYIK